MPKKRITKPPSEDKQSLTSSYELDEVDHKLLRHIMEYPQDSLSALGKVVGMNKTSVHARYKKPAFQRALAEMRAETWDIIKRGQNAAARALLKLATNSKDEKVRLDAAKTLLGPILNKGELTVHNVQEIIHRTRFGEQGEMISDSITVEKTTPKNTIELLGESDDKEK